MCRWWPELQWWIRRRLWCVPSLSGGLRHVLRSWAGGGSPGLAPGTWRRSAHLFYFLCFYRQRFSLFPLLRWRLWGLALWGEAGVIVVVQPPGRWHLAEAWVGLPPAKQSFHLHSLPQKHEKQAGSSSWGNGHETYQQQNQVSFNFTNYLLSVFSLHWHPGQSVYFSVLRMWTFWTNNWKTGLGEYCTYPDNSQPGSTRGLYV